MKKIHLIVILLLSIFLLVNISSILVKSISNDELVHISAGYSYWKTFDMRMNKEHPPLVKLLSGIPLLVLQPEIHLDSPRWKQGREWEFGAEFIFFSNTNTDQLIFWARLPIILLGILLGMYVFRWAKELYGDAAGIFALLLYVFSPNILAQSRFVTTDLGITCFSFITIYYFWKFCNKKMLRNLILTGVFFGLALSSKFTGIYLFGIIALLGAGWLYLTYRHKKILEIIVLKDTKALIVWICAIFGIGVFVLLCTYFFINSIYYLRGLLAVIQHSGRGHNSFLMGMYSTTGWWYYFVIAFLIKTPISFIAILMASIGLYKKSKFSKNDLFLILPVIVFFLSFVFNNINIGIRHILPVYPFLFVFVSRLTTVEVSWKKILRIGIVICLISFIISSVLIFPHYLSYFNVLIGGPTQGHKYLSDSNIDWGQDLKGLKPWMDSKGVDNITMSYFGKDSRDYRGIIWNELKCGPQTGIIAISAARLIGFNEKDAECTKWLHSHTPIDHIGYSIKIYDIAEEDIVLQREEYCSNKCQQKCDKELLQLGSSLWNGTCKCRCVRY